MPNPFLRILPVGFLALATVLVGVLGYRHFSGLSWLDALYMTVTTLSTVGYREVGEPDDDSKLFTILLLFFGAGILVYSVTAAVDLLLNPETRRWLVLREARRRARNMKNHYIICGLGRVGRAVGEELGVRGVPFLIIERDPEIAAQAAARGWLSLQGNATHDPVLEEAGIRRARGLVSCVDSDAENLFIVISARALNPGLKISSRLVDEANLEKFKRAGADHIYSPYQMLGRRIARSVTRPRVLELLDLALEDNNFDLTIEEGEIPEGSALIGQTLVQSQLRQRHGAVVMSLIRADRSVVHNPSSDTRFQAGDILIMVGTPAQLDAARSGKDLVRA